MDYPASPAAAGQLLANGLHSLSDLVQELACMLHATSLTEPSAAASYRLLAMQYSQTHMPTAQVRAARSYMQKLPASMRHIGPALAAEVCNSQLLFVHSISALLTAAREALQRLDAAISFERREDLSTQRVLLFHRTWEITRAGCLWLPSCGPFHTDIATSQLQTPTNLSKLQPVLLAFMAWLLDFVRDNSDSHLTLRTFKSQGHTWVQAILHFMHPAIILLSVMQDTPPAEFNASIAALPTGFVATLCCLVCEATPEQHASTGVTDPVFLACLLDHSVMVHKVEQLLSSMNAVSTHVHTHSTGPFNPDMVCPAAIEVVKRSVCALLSSSNAAVEDAVSAQLTLNHILVIASQRQEALLNSSIPHTFKQSGGDSGGNSSSTGGGGVIPRRLTLDLDLMSHLVPFSLQFPRLQCVGSSTQIFMAMLDRWLHGHAEWLNPQGLACLAQVLCFCSHHLWRSMQRQRNKEAVQPFESESSHPEDEITQLLVLTSKASCLFTCNFNTSDVASLLSLAVWPPKQQRQPVCSSLAWRKVHVWRRLPGSIVVLEMILRDPLTRQSFRTCRDMVQQGLVLIIRQLKSKLTLASCKMLLGLTVAIHKLLLHCTDWMSHHLPLIQPTADDSCAMPDFVMIHMELHAALTAMLVHMRTGTREGGYLAACRPGSGPSAQAFNTTSKDSGCRNSSSTRSTRTSRTLCKSVMESNSAEAVAATPQGGCSSSSSNINSSMQNNDTSGGCDGTDLAPVAVKCSSVEEGLHQLQAVTLMVLVWLGNFRTRVAGRQSWGVDPLERLDVWLAWERKVRVQDAELADVAFALSLPLQPSRWKGRASSFTLDATAWDGFAVKHFHGRLLPGCSYLGCTNMDGTSELTLPTQLCSGCRRTRYCSQACQRAAWLIGGHSEMCCKGKWAIG